MSDIQPGDVVECTNTTPIDHPRVRVARAGGLRIGAVYRVTDTWVGYSGKVFLRITPFRHSSERSGCCADHFRKIAPGKLEFVGLTERKVPVE